MHAEVRQKPCVVESRGERTDRVLARAEAVVTNLAPFYDTVSTIVLEAEERFSGLGLDPSVLESSYE